MPTFNPSQSFTIVGGRPGVSFMQDGHAFNAAYECLGKCNDQGEVERKKAPINPTAPPPVPPPPQGNDTQQGDGDKELASLKADELKAIASEAGIEGAASMTKAALIEAITESQQQNSNDGDEGKGEVE